MPASQEQKLKSERMRQEVLELSKTKSFSEITKELKLSIPTVKKYLGRISIPNHYSDCIVCGTKFGSIKPSKFCSDKCSLNNAISKNKKKRNDNWEGKIENYDYVFCRICNMKSGDLGSHLKHEHNMNAKEYRKIFGKDAKTKPQKSIDAMTGENNPAYQHGGSLSPFSDKFIKGNSKIEETKKKAKDNKTKDKDNTQIDYWLIKSDGDLSKAQGLLSERQTTFSLEKCIEKYGDEKGKEFWLKRQEKWQSNYKKTNFSKVSQELFWSITNDLEKLDNIYFAQLDENKEKDESGSNHEYVLKLNECVVKPDFIDISQNKIIEFDGSYWHQRRNNHYQYDKHPDTIKDEIIENNEYSILRIPELDYKKDKQGTIEKCLNFLKQ